MEEQKQVVRSQQICQYNMPITVGQHKVLMPADADVFKVGAMGSAITLWATVNHPDPDPMEERLFWVAQTGSVLPAEKYPGPKVYLGTAIFITGPRALHVWQLPKPGEQAGEETEDKDQTDMFRESDGDKSEEA